MPLMHSGSKKALKKNIKTEMEAHPSPEKRKQNIAIAYEIQRRAKKGKKKMADGGFVQHEHDYPSKRHIDDHEDEMLLSKDHEMHGAHEHEDEIMHKMYPKDEDERMRDADEHMYRSKAAYARGGIVEDEYHDDEEMLHQKLHVDGSEEDRRLRNPDFKEGQEESPMSKYRDYGKHLDEEMHREYDRDPAAYADGGEIIGEDEDEEEMPVHEYIRHDMKAKMYADGGEVDLDLNAEEMPNEEDEMAFDLLRKKRIMGEALDMHQDEDSNEHEPEHEAMDEHDMVSHIRKKMRMRKM